jgi:hypothetical protein
MTYFETKAFNYEDIILYNGFVFFFIVMCACLERVTSLVLRIPVAKDPYRVSFLSYDFGQGRVALAATDPREIRKRGER